MNQDRILDSFDVVVIGGGAAGLYTALSLPDTFQVALITKDTLKQSASDWAQGGIAAAMRSDDSPDLHAQDTYAAGVGLCEPSAVNLLVNEAQAQIANLLDMGVAFDRQQQQLAFTLEAAHSKPRVLHSADATGKALIKTLTNQVFLQPNIQVLSDFFSIDLLIAPDSGHCYGVMGSYEQRITSVLAGVVVLATGGGGQVFSETTNPALSTGDGVAMAWRAGAIVRDLEFFQFHPTALKAVGAPRFLISEAVRGEGAHLIDHNGDRFMTAYHELGDLAPRDIVSQSIISHLAKSGQENVWLDLRSIPAEKIQYRFPKIIRVCQSWGINILQDPIPVAPAAHYWMGGVQTNLNAQTSIKGLYAVGEVASTGVHGANRLASNSLMECLVFGAALAKTVTEALTTPRHNSKHNVSAPTANLPQVAVTVATSSQNIRENLACEMWSAAGITRNQQGLSAALQTIQNLNQQFLDASEQIETHENTPEINSEYIRLSGETRNLLDISKLILKSALYRQESRGGHFRADFPYQDPEWLVHTVIQQEIVSSKKLGK